MAAGCADEYPLGNRFCRPPGSESVQVLLNRHPIQGSERQVDKHSDALVELEEGGAKRVQLVLLTAFRRDGVGDAPVGTDRVPRPDRAGLVRGVIADGYDEVELRRFRWRELVPAFAALRGGREFRLFQHLDGDRVNLASWCATNASRQVTHADKQDLEFRRARKIHATPPVDSQLPSEKRTRGLLQVGDSKAKPQVFRSPRQQGFYPRTNL